MERKERFNLIFDGLKAALTRCLGELEADNGSKRSPFPCCLAFPVISPPSSPTSCLDASSVISISPRSATVGARYVLLTLS